MIASGLSYRNDLDGAGKAISVPFGINGVRNKWSHLVEPPLRTVFQSQQFGSS